jgi:hypothetical protein
MTALYHFSRALFFGIIAAQLFGADGPRHHCSRCKHDRLLIGMCENSAMASNHGTDDEQYCATMGM